MAEPLTVVHVVGARPNFMKVAPLLRTLEEESGVANVLVHTGQHYDEEMSGAFFRDLGIRPPDVDLEVGSGTHGAQTGAVLERFEKFLSEHPADLVVVVGDVNSTMAAALAAAKLFIPVAHVEAGLRSHDRSMPEELNRIVTDQLCEMCLTPSRDADENLRTEGIPEERIHFVGNIMIDSLLAKLPAARELEVAYRMGIDRKGYGVVTLHRPSNVDDPETLRGILVALEEIGRELPLVFPVHPRTKERAEVFGLELSEVGAVEPLGYLEMLSLIDGAAVVFTDSGGLQEETTALNVPCLTLRDTTERPITVTEGTNRLVPDRSPDAILAGYKDAMNHPVEGQRPELWDGCTAPRIRDVIVQWWESERLGR